MRAIRPVPAPLVGRAIRLDPLRREDIPELYEAVGRHAVVFAGGWGGGPHAYRDSLEGFTKFALAYFAWDTGNPYAIRVVGGEHDGVLIGTSTLGDFEPAFEHTHIGWTAYDPRVWGSQVNVEAKLLLLGLAFDSGFGRVKIQADDRNERSRAAIAKLGATFEGFVRRDRQRADGSWRDSAVFSVLVDEWPRVRAGLEERFDSFGGEPVRFREPRTDVGGIR